MLLIWMINKLYFTLNMLPNTIFSLPVWIAVVLLACRQVSSTSPVISEAEGLSKSLAGSSASFGTAGSSGSGGGSSASSAADSAASAYDLGVFSPLGVLSKAKSVSKSFSFTGPEVRPLPPSGRPNPIPNPVPNPLPLPPCTPNPEYIVVPQYIPASGSIFANVPVVTLFTNAFLDYGYSNGITRELFDLSMVHVDQYADFVRRNAERSFVNLGVEDASTKIQFLYEAIMRNFGCSGCPKLSLAIVIRKTANFIAHVLYVEDILTLNNAKSLGLAYAKAMAYSASVTMTSDPTSKFPALCNGVISFLKFVGLYTKEKVQTVIFYDGTEWYKAASDYRWW